MKRVCSLCLNDYKYQDVKRFTHGLQLCDTCQDVIAALAESKPI